jgi:hypothetical protein
MSEVDPEPRVDIEEDPNRPSVSRRVTVQSGGSPTVPKVFFVICSIGVLVMMIGPLAFVVVGWFLVYVGGLILALGFLAAGCLSTNISQNTRLGLILGAAMVFGMVIWFFQTIVYEICRRIIWVGFSG